LNTTARFTFVPGFTSFQAAFQLLEEREWSVAHALSMGMGVAGGGGAAALSSPDGPPIASGVLKKSHNRWLTVTITYYLQCDHKVKP
jgi:hypothetical protein